MLKQKNINTKIIITTYSLHNGGMEKSLLRLIKYLISLNYKPIILLTESKGEMYEEFLNMCEVKFIENKKWGAYHFLNHLKFEINSVNPEILINICDKYTQAIIPFLNKKIRIVSALRSEDKYFLDLITSNEKFIDAYICNSPRIFDLITEKIRIKKDIFIIPNGYSYKESATLINSRIVLDNEIKLLFIGRLAPEKNTNILTEIITECNKRGILVSLDIVGDGIMKPILIKQIETLGFENQINIHGFKSGKELIEFYKSSHLLIFSSIGEGLPNVLLEAQYFGCVPIANLLPKITDYIVLNKITGYIVKNNEPVSFVSAIETVWMNKQSWLEMSINAQEWIKNNFSMEIERLNYFAAFDKISSQKNSPKKINISSFYNIFKLINIKEFLPKSLFELLKRIKYFIT